MEKINELLAELYSLLLEHGLNLIYALLTLVIGFWIIKRVTKLTARGLDKTSLDDSLIPFVKNLVSILLKTFLVVAVISMLGVETTSFIAVLGAA